MQRPSLYMSTGETKQRVIGGKKVQQILIVKTDLLLLPFKMAQSQSHHVIVFWSAAGMVKVWLGLGSIVQS